MHNLVWSVFWTKPVHLNSQSCWLVILSQHSHQWLPISLIMFGLTYAMVFQALANGAAHLGYLPRPILSRNNLATKLTLVRFKHVFHGWSAKILTTWPCTYIHICMIFFYLWSWRESMFVTWMCENFHQNLAHCIHNCLMLHANIFRYIEQLFNLPTNNFKIKSKVDENEWPSFSKLQSHALACSLSLSPYLIEFQCNPEGIKGNGFCILLQHWSKHVSWFC